MSRPVVVTKMPTLIFLITAFKMVMNFLINASDTSLTFFDRMRFKVRLSFTRSIVLFKGKKESIISFLLIFDD